MIRYEPTLPRASFGLAALILSVLTIGLMVVLPAELETDSEALALRAEARRAAAASPAPGAPQLRCTVPVALSGPLSLAAAVLGPDLRCTRQS